MMLCQEVATTIIDQLGGANSLHRMIGADYFSVVPSGPNIRGGLRFKLKAFGRPRINLIQINLNDHDLYDVSFYFVRRTQTGPVVKTVAQAHDVYFDQLKSTIESNTGFVLTMPRVRSA